MASNTPVPFQVVKSTAEKIAETIIPERVIVSDPVAKVTVIGDGVTKGGVPFGASEQWNKFYAGTLEELQANPEALAALLKDAPANGLLFVVSEDIVNPDGTINEEELQAYLEENYLKLTGGTLTGNLVLQNMNYGLNDLPANASILFQIRFKDKDGSLLNYIGCNLFSDAKRQVYLAGGSSSTYLGIQEDANGLDFVYCSTPPVDAPNYAVQNKESVIRDFLPRTGGTLSGYLDFAQNYTVGETTTNSLYGNRLRFVDQTGFDCGALINMYTADGGIRTFMQAANKKSDGSALYSMILLGIDEDGVQYSALPEPRGLYNNDGATAKWVMDYAPQKLTVAIIDIIVGGTGASDTADLNNGRGLSYDKPFATFNAAVSWALAHYVGAICNINFVINADISVSAINICAYNVGSVTITSTSNTKHTINISQYIACIGGIVSYKNIKLNGNSSNSAFYGRHNNIIIVETGVEVSGSFTSATANIAINSALYLNATISGSCTGKRYGLAAGGAIYSNGKGVNAIPGTEAGTVDTSSIYV